jgi:cation diffusion facilitator family transporter
MTGSTASSAKARAALISVASNTALTGAKLAAAAATHSVSILSEAVHSGLDLAAALMAYTAVRASRKPADPDHTFGHGKFESMSGLAEGVLILAAVALIMWGASSRLLSGEAEVALPAVGAVVMGISALVNIWVSGMLFRTARATESIALEADAWHLRTDVWTSVGVLGGMAAIALGVRLGLTGVHIIDPLIAFAVAAVIAHAAWDIIRRSYGHLVDRSLPQGEIESIESLLREHYPQLSGYHRLRTRRAGPERYIDLHLVVPGRQSVAEAHTLCDHLETDLERLLPGAEIMIHVEPAQADD